MINFSVFLRACKHTCTDVHLHVHIKVLTRCNPPPRVNRYKCVHLMCKAHTCTFTYDAFVRHACRLGNPWPRVPAGGKCSRGWDGGHARGGWERLSMKGMS